MWLGIFDSLNSVREVANVSIRVLIVLLGNNQVLQCTSTTVRLSA